jgi:hypothetical protein
VSTSTEFIKIACILLYKNILPKVTNYEVFSLLRFLFNNKYIQNMYIVLPFVGIVLAETQQRRDIGMLIT